MGASAAALWSTISGAVGTAASAASAALPAGTGAAVAGGVAGATVGAGLSALLAPDIPGVKGPTPLPDQSAVDQAKKRSILLQRQRAGRESTILSQGDGGTLG